MRIKAWQAALTVVVLAGGVLVGCVNTVLPAIPNDPAGPEPDRGALSALLQAEETARDDSFDRLQAEVYGRYPAAVASVLAARRVVDAAAFDGAATIEELTLDLQAGGLAARANLALVTPNVPGPHPAIILQTFCGNRAALGGRPDVSTPFGPYPEFCDRGAMTPLATYIFGRHISSPPLERLIAEGYALAFIYPGDLVADDADAGLAALNAIDPRPEAADRTGALAAWAWLYSRAVDVLVADARIDAQHIAIWGHSRHGKASLLAAAADPRIAAVIAHQSGKGGATPTRSYAGESVRQITEGYPHWFAPKYAGFADNEDAVGVDQHELIALIAPRPVFLGNARRDKWSDPAGAFRAARAASAVYARDAAVGLRQADMTDFDPAAEIAFYLRPGRHGVTTADWSAFLAFLDAHFKSTAG